jgi:hypothetical protein
LEILKIDCSKYNYVVRGAKKYFIFKVSNKKSILTSALCPHRGGPLHLAERSKNDNGIICPWHETNISMKYLLNNSIPTVRRGNILIAIFADSRDQATELLYKNVIVSQQNP